MIDLVEALRSIGEPTRLRVLALLSHGELAVGELVEILSMSQPRLSRHLKFLTSAGLVDRLPEGAWVFYRLPVSGKGRELVDAILPFIADDDPDFARDRQRLALVKEARANAAEDYFNRQAESWDDVRGHHYPTGEVESALLSAAGAGSFDLMIDLGTGTGRMLSLFAGRYSRAEGVDLSHKMLNVARTNLERDGVVNAGVRYGDVTAPPFDDGSADLVILHQVLHYLDRPERVLAEASRILKPGGRLLIVDFAPHEQEFLRNNHEHRRLGISDLEISQWSEAADLSFLEPIRFSPTDETGLTVNLWTVEKRAGIGERAA